VDQTLLKTLRDTWLSDDEYQHQRGILEEYIRVMNIIEDIEKRTKDKSTLKQLRLAKRKIRKNL
jgi:hypothetical protein